MHTKSLQSSEVGTHTSLHRWSRDLRSSPALTLILKQSRGKAEGRAGYPRPCSENSEGVSSALRISLLIDLRWARKPQLRRIFIQNAFKPGSSIFFSSQISATEKLNPEYPGTTILQFVLFFSPYIYVYFSICDPKQG